MARRLIDIILATLALILLSPLLLIAAGGVWLSGGGPILYRAKRSGLNGQIFTMLKFRTMIANQKKFSSAITAGSDPRVFPFGKWLRRLKIDELPQLFNILQGEMSVVGPRPEDPRIVEKYYRGEQFETLRVLPGLASPGSIYNYTHGERMIGSGDPERDYVERLLPIKLALDMVYVRNRSFFYDVKIVFRTVWIILLIALGKEHFADPPEMKYIEQLKLLTSDGVFER